MSTYRRFPAAEAAANPLAGIVARLLAVGVFAGLAALAARIFLAAAPF